MFGFSVALHILAAVAFGWLLWVFLSTLRARKSLNLLYDVSKKNAYVDLSCFIFQLCQALAIPVIKEGTFAKAAKVDLVFFRRLLFEHPWKRVRIDTDGVQIFLEQQVRPSEQDLEILSSLGIEVHNL